MKRRGEKRKRREEMIKLSMTTKESYREKGMNEEKAKN